MSNDEIHSKTETQRIDCTGCGQCMKDCPLELRIPDLIGLYNTYLAGAAVESLVPEYERLTSDSGKAGDCACCRVCEGSCAFRVRIGDTIAKISDVFD